MQNLGKGGAPDQEQAENGLHPQESREGEAGQEVKIESERRKISRKIKRRIPKREIGDQDPDLEGLDHVLGDPQNLIRKYREIMMKRKKVSIPKKANQKKKLGQLLIKDHLKNLIIWIYLIHHKHQIYLNSELRMNGFIKIFLCVVNMSIIIHLVFAKYSQINLI